MLKRLTRLSRISPLARSPAVLCPSLPLANSAVWRFSTMNSSATKAPCAIVSLVPILGSSLTSSLREPTSRERAIQQTSKPLS
eukprot:33173_6